MSESSTPVETLEEVVERVRDTAHDRFRFRPGTAEHGEAIAAEIDADHAFNDEIQRRGSLSPR